MSYNNGNCLFCNKGPHKAANCFNMKHATKMLMEEDPNLTPEKIWNATINGVECDSSAIKNFFANRQKYMIPPRQPTGSYNPGQQRGGYQPRGRGNYNNNRGSGRGRWIRYNGYADDNNNNQPTNNSSQPSSSSNQSPNGNV